jgi:ADP-ribosylation factor-like protein 4
MRHVKPVIHTHREEHLPSAVKTRELLECENESSLGCCSFGETKSRDYRPQPQFKPLVSTYFKGFMSWMSKGTNAIMDVLPSSSTEDFHLVMIGLDGAGKTTALYRMKLDQYLNTVPTIGFNCERVAGTVGRSAGLTYLVWDVSGQDKIRPLWRSYTRSTDGIIFVLDSADYRTLDEARLELYRAVHYQDNMDIPLLVLANKQDLPKTLGEEEVIKALGLRSLNNVLWSVQLACSITGEGLDTGIEMMHMMIVKKKMMSKRKRNQTR